MGEQAKPAARQCCYCGAVDKELRPYGPNGAFTCFSCGTATPEREAEMRKNIRQQFIAAAALGRGVSIGSEDGPKPLFTNLKDMH